MIDVKGRWALVTGASRGIGKLAAEELAKSGCNLILHSRNKQHTEKFEKELSEKYGIKAVSVECKLGEIDDLRRMLGEIDDMGVDIDIVLNNAGIQSVYRENIYDTAPEDYTEHFNVNTIAPMVICYHFIPKMVERGFGRVVNTTSGIALEPEQAGYSASKAALDKVTIDLGSKLNGTDVIISLADPGWCRTDLGGEKAPNAPESAIPGVIVGAFVNDGVSGRLFRASDFYDMTPEEAVSKGETMSAPY